MKEARQKVYIVYDSTFREFQEMQVNSDSWSVVCCGMDGGGAVIPKGCVCAGMKGNCGWWCTVHCLVVVMVSQLHTGAQAYQVICFKYAQCILCRLYLNEVKTFLKEKQNKNKDKKRTSEAVRPEWCLKHSR